LSTNYRSSQLVVRHAGFLISHNTDREVKNVRSKDGKERGKVELFIGEDIGQERNFLVRALNGAKEEGFQWKDLAVLVRYKELYQPVIDALERADIPFVCVAKGKIYSRRAARALTDFFAAVLEFPFPPKKVWDHVLKVSDIYPGNEYLGEVSQATDPISFLRSGRNTRDADQRKSIAKLLSNLRALSEKQKSENLNTYDLFQAIDAAFKLTNHFKQEPGASDDNDAADDGLVIDVLQEKAKDFSDPREFLKYCKDERDREGIEGDGVEKGNIYEKDSKDAVQVMTIHRAKGTEWRGVVLFHQEWRQGSYFANDPKEEQKRVEEEERRVVYVGATRAGEALWVTAERGKKSRFVEELFRDPGFRDRDPQQEVEYRQERLGNLKQEIGQLKTEENQERIKMDRAQGIERDRIRSELDAVKEGARFLRRCLWFLGLKSARLRKLERGIRIVEEADQAEQQVDQIQSQLNAKKKRIAEISEEMDHLRREVMFRRILSDPIEEGNSSQAAPF
jgi:superfamily I DNA/RNA helicase